MSATNLLRYEHPSNCVDINHTTLSKCVWPCSNLLHVVSTVMSTGTHTWLTRNTLWNRATPVPITLTLSEPGAFQMMSGVADIGSKWPRNDTTVAHNTTCELSTVLQPNTSLIWSCAHNTKVCKCATCEDNKLVACLTKIQRCGPHVVLLQSP